MRKLLLVGVASLFGAVIAAGQQVSIVDVYIAKVKPEKRGDFDAISKKIADANRKHKGDVWTTSQVEYGEQNTLYFTSGRSNYAAIDDGSKAFQSAIKESYGAAAMEKLMRDSDSCLISSRGEIRRVRADLSSNMTSDPAALFKLIGQSRFVRTTMVRVRPGKTLNFEEQIRMVKGAGERENPSRVTLVSQSSVGQTGALFYLTNWGDSMAALDPPNVPRLLGESGYQRFSSMSAENTLGVETIITRYLPELSNPPAEIVAADPSFWTPKPTAPSKPKPPAN